MKFRYQKLPLGYYNPKHPLVPRPFLPIHLVGINRKTEAPFWALLDSGADRVIMPIDLAQEVGVYNVEQGRPEPAMGISGQPVPVYYHPLNIQVIGNSNLLPIEIGFMSAIPIPLLGRSFFKHFTSVIFHEEKEEVELKTPHEN